MLPGPGLIFFLAAAALIPRILPKYSFGKNSKESSFCEGNGYGFVIYEILNWDTKNYILEFVE